MSRITKIVCSTIISTGLITAALSGSVVIAAEKQVMSTQNLKTFQGTTLKKVMITTKSYIEIKDVIFQYNKSEKITHFTVTVYNGDNTPIDFMDYWVQLSDVNGSKYPIKENPTNKKSFKIAPQTTEEFKFYSSVNPKLNYKDLNLKLIKWDFGSANYEKTMGEVKLTSSYTSTVPTNHYYILRDGTEKIRTTVIPATVFQMKNQRQVQINYQLENIGLYTKDLSTYQYYLRTQSGSIINLNALNQVDNELEPGKKQTITLGGTISSKVSLNEAQLLVIRKEGETNFESPVAYYKIPWDNKSSLIAQINGTRTMEVEGQKIESIVQYSYYDETELHDEVSVNIKWLNRGSTEVSLPKYKFELYNRENDTTYPLAIESDEVMLVPGLQKEVTLKGKIPSKSSNSLILLVHQPKTETTPSYVMGGFRLEGATTDISSQLRKEYTTENGKYDVEVTKVERLPWGDEDIVNIFVDVTNIGTKTQSVLNLKGSVKLDGVTLNDENSVLLKLNNQIMLPMKESSRYVVSTKLPYNYDFSNLTLSLNEEVSENNRRSIGQFNIDKINNTNTIALNKPFIINSTGRNAALQYEKSAVFEAKNSNMYYVQFSYTNEENRFTNLPVLQAYFKTKDNQYIEAELKNVESKVSPTGNALLIMTANVPKSFNKDTVEIIIGEALTEGEYSKPDQSPDRFIKAGSYLFKPDQTEVKDNFVDLELNPYKLSINRIDAGITGNSTLKLDLRYTLTDEKLYEVNENKRKLLFEINDGTSTYEQVVELNNTEGMILGENQPLSVSFTGDYIGRVLYQGYRLNIYEELNGHRNLLVTKDYNRFYVSNENDQF